jgi:hypothetical protein
MNPIIDDVLCIIGLAAFNVAVGFLLYGFAPEIVAWAAQ